ncbi:MAG: DUF4012 domain-containing protein [Candidatus Moraniibacteriota bacterium]
MKKRKQKNNVIPQMFDVRPVDESGGFSAEKYANLPKEIKIEEKKKYIEKRSPGVPVDDILKKDAKEIDKEKKDFLERKKEEKDKKEKLVKQRIIREQERLEKRRSIRESLLKDQREERELRKAFQNRKEDQAKIKQQRIEKKRELEEVKRELQFLSRQKEKEKKDKNALLQTYQEILNKEAGIKKKRERREFQLESKREQKKTGWQVTSKTRKKERTAANLATISEKAKSFNGIYLGRKFHEKEIPFFVSLNLPREITNLSIRDLTKKAKFCLDNKEKDLNLNLFGKALKDRIEERSGYYKELLKEQEREERQKQKKLIIQESKKRGEQKKKAAFLQRKQKEEQKRLKIQKKRRKKEKRKNIQLRQNQIRKEKKEKVVASILKAFSFKNDYFPGFNFKRSAISFGCLSLTVFLIFFSGRFAFYGLQLKDEVFVKGEKASRHIAQAKQEFENKNINKAVLSITQAKNEIKSANERINKLGGSMLEAFSYVPFLSKIGNGKKTIEAGEDLMEAASDLAVIAEKLSKVENPFSSKESRGQKTGDVLLEMHRELTQAGEHLKQANKKIQEINAEDVPENYREEFKKGQEFLPEVIEYIETLEKNQFVFKDLLGYHGPRKYLFLFQNNQEMRATGGFIGSYGVLDVHNGHFEELFIDGIYNPDGQLKVNVVPPKPVQKISAAWSTHDANWFPDFPTSAEKISWFYEKTGGPTVDGVITFTPDLIKKLLKITGPIEMPKYEVTLTAENFMEKTQYEVEFDYDKEKNRPKKIIADLAPKLLEKVFAQKNPEGASKTLNAFSEALNEKHLLVYSRDKEIQELVSQLGWSGEVLDTRKDYLMVVNSNLNGYKTDGVIDQEIDHKAEIQPDGSIINTVSVTRKHNGGNTGYEFWDEVNSNYMRVYVPKGSELIDVQGHTREKISSPVDYEKLNFQKDPLVAKQEDSIRIDEETGTRVYKEENKTVFGNWVYVSPQEEVEVTYKYKLPFKLDLDKNQEKSDYYSLLAQKQSGSVETGFKSSIATPDNAELFWKHPESAKSESGDLFFENDLVEDEFYGFVLKKK